MRPDAQQGSSLPVAIFLLVVLALLAVVLLRLAGGGASSTAFEATSTRAYLAARSGMEWGSAQLAADPDCGAVAGVTLDLAADPGMSGCSATLACNGQTVDSAPLIVFSLTSVGDCQAGDLSASRTLDGFVEVAP
ncbi:MAG: hypothetical protein WED00_10670 [Aquisalimonadaceae bacterium]